MLNLDFVYTDDDQFFYWQQQGMEFVVLKMTIPGHYMFFRFQYDCSLKVNIPEETFEEINEELLNEDVY